MSYFYRPAGGGEGVEEYANYDALPSSTEGATARTTNNNQTWRYSTVAGCWIPSEFYDADLAIQQDRSATPKDLDFKTPQISDFSGLSGYDPSIIGSATDGTDEIELTSNSSIRFTRETHTGDSLIIVNVDYQTVGAAGYFRNGIQIQGHTNNSSDELVVLDFGGPTLGSDNHAVFAVNFAGLGTNMRPAEGAPFAAGGRIFMRWNSGQQTTNTTPAFIECIIQDLNQSRKLRTLYAGLENNGGFPLHSVTIRTNPTGGASRSLKLKRFQVLKYT